MGIRTLVTPLVLLASFSVQAASLPMLPPPKLADLSLKVTTPTHPLAPATDSRTASDRSGGADARWLNERQPLAQEQRWVF
ncbi:hypothetical protein [Pseudomonas oryzihabitans]|uniref:hypothetical protein n=1 Tax=Pseudomonas oryzihabitans TaxID=47885 RepID=UPI00289599B3|nr:hypothetical protein [Pseudomonas oryzihabitans]MDT3720234.1 hypothetical protein [Pseudomonas oryzihabitans]